MSDRGFRQQRSRFLRGMADDMSEERSTPVIGRITQLTETVGIPVSVVGSPGVWDRLPSGKWYRVTPMYLLLARRVRGRAIMVVTRVAPFSSSYMGLSDLEMDLVMDWANKMIEDDIGRFTPADGGWMWWRK